MSDPTNTDGATVNTDGATENTDAQTTSGPAGGDDAGSFEYPDGSKPQVDPETGLPVLEDRTADFPDVEATEVVAEPVLESGRRLGWTSGVSAYRGLASKRAAKAAAAEAASEEHSEEPESIEQGQEAGQEAPEGSGTTDDTSGDENDAETGDQGSGDEADGSGAASDAGEESGDEDSVEDAGDATPADESEPAADEGFEPGEHTVDEVQAYLIEHPDQATYVIDRERTGKARKTLIGA